MKFSDFKRCYILLDFNNIVWRSFYGTQRQNMINDDGINVGFIVGFFKILGYAINKAKQENYMPELVLALDSSPTRKRELYKNNQDLFRNHKADRDWNGKDPRYRVRYKGNRPAKEDMGYNPIRICLEFMGCIKHLEIFCEDEEADDVIASAVKVCPKHRKILLYSTDKDLWQLLKYPNVEIFGLDNNRITKEDVQRKFLSDCDHVILHKILNGDDGDNVKHIIRYPFKSTLKSYQDCDGTFKDYVRLLKVNDNTKALKMLLDNIKLLQFNQQVIRLKSDLPNAEDLFDANPKLWNELCYKYQVPSLLNSSFTSIF